MAWGLALLMLSVSLSISVMMWIVALFTLPFAVLLLGVAAIQTRNRAASTLRQFAGFGLLLLGLVALTAAAVGGTISATGVEAGIWVAGSWPIAPLLIGPGLRLWTGWLTGRRLKWCLVAWLFPFGTLLLQQTLVAMGLLALSA